MALQKGFIALHRSLLSWGWHDDPSTGWLFVNLILMANHYPSEWKGITIERGQLVTGRKALANQTGLSERQIRTALEHLKTTGEVSIKSTNKYSVITIVNYGKFQDVSETATSKTPNILTSNRPATDQQPTTKKQCNNDKQDDVVCATSADELTDAISAHQRADDLIRRYHLPDSDTTRESLLEDAEKHGFDRLEDALKRASLSNSRPLLSVNYYRSALSNDGARVKEGGTNSFADTYERF